MADLKKAETTETYTFQPPERSIFSAKPAYRPKENKLREKPIKLPKTLRIEPL